MYVDHSLHCMVGTSMFDNIIWFIILEADITPEIFKKMTDADICSLLSSYFPTQVKLREFRDSQAIVEPPASKVCLHCILYLIKLLQFTHYGLAFQTQ